MAKSLNTEHTNEINWRWQLQ